MNTLEFEAASAVYSQLTVKHPKQNAALERAVFLSTQCANVDFVILAGPTGVGKSSLLRRLEIAVTEIYAPQVLQTPSMVAMISTTAIADGAKKFGWRRLWTDGNAALNDPFVLARSWRTADAPKSRRLSEPMPVAVARETFEQELRLRRTRIWSIDEAHHILLGGSAGVVGDQFDVLKSVGQVTNITLVLCGTYQLSKLLSYSGQVMRRSATVTLAPYDLSSDADRKVFAGVCKALLEHVPVECKLDPKLFVEELFYGTLGCVGVLKDWISRAWALSHFKSVPLGMDHFIATRLPSQTLRSMHDEIIEWEQMNTSSSDVEYRERVNAYANSKRTGDQSSRLDVRPAPQSVPTGKPAMHVHSKRRVGERLPGRDLVYSSDERSAFAKVGDV